MTINADVTLTIRTNATLTCNNITNNGTLVIEDGGQLIISDDANVIAIVKKEISAVPSSKDGETNKGWYSISSPVNNASITGNTNSISLRFVYV